MAAVTKHDETAIGLLLAGSHLARLDPIDCQNYIAERGIRPVDLKDGFSWLQARIEAFNARSGWVWAERSLKAHRLALQASALVMVSTPLAAAEQGGACFGAGRLAVGGLLVMTIMSLASVAVGLLIGGAARSRQGDEL